MKKLLSLLFALGLTLSACGTAQTQAVSLAQTSTPTLTPTIALTPTATITPLPTIPTFTPTFDVRTIVTVTPAEKAECPESNTKTLINLPDKKEYIPEDFSEYTQPMLDFLNLGGSPQELLKEAKVKYFSNKYEAGELWDFTNDGVKELVLRYPGFIIFSCSHKKYNILYQESLLSSYEFHYDLNLDNIPEIIKVSSWFCNNCLLFNVYEWDGGKFKSIGYDEINGPEIWDVEHIDIDNNGIEELIVKGDIPGPCCMDMGIPWRNKTFVYSWNGNIFSESYVSFDKAKYRFQVIQDGDRELLYGNNEKALLNYQNVISDKSLGWWTQERRDYEVKIYYDSYNPITPTPLPYPLEDPAEYPSLAAYAYYRIMLLQLVQGQESEAASTYETLQQTFGSDSYGHPYVEMATAFWDAYQSTHKMYDGCASAIQYAVEHPELLTPLGSDYHGSQSHKYVPADVCPFR